MLKKLFSLFQGAGAPPETPQAGPGIPPPAEVAVPGAPPLPIAAHISLHEGFPRLAWEPVQTWVEALAGDEARSHAWTAAERAWLLHMRQALGPDFRVSESANAMLVSSLEPHVARATLDYMERTLVRVGRLLDGIGQVPPWGKDLLLVFDDEESYYRYVSYFYPASGEFAFSGGMFISAGCSHYVTMKNDLRVVEPVIAHEMTHAFVSHLPLPLWLNEGLAVNTEHRLAGAHPSHTPQEMRAKHLAYWGEQEIQEFWSGESFMRTDDGNLLSYDLARLIVGHFAQDWDVFKAFVLEANAADAGAAAADGHFGVDLGEIACALLEREHSGEWSPRR
ncbi:MAG: hypothetical protein V4757_11225 [Pseudomonadota bacterium]